MPRQIYVRKTNLGFRKKLAKIMKIKSELIDPHTREKRGSRGLNEISLEDLSWNTCMMIKVWTPLPWLYMV